MPFEPKEYIRHMLDEIDFILQQIKNLTREEFFADHVLRRAFIRSLEIIGEASKKLPGEFRAQHPHIDWKRIAGTRDRLIHDYFGVDYDIIWDIVENKLPGLQKNLRKIL